MNDNGETNVRGGSSDGGVQGDSGLSEAHPAPAYTDDVEYLSTTAQVEALAGRLARVESIAVDLESDSLYHYYEKVCLIQISADGIDTIIDPLDGADLSPLKPVFADPAIEKIFHSADNDLAMLYRTWGIETVGLFDTMVAAQICGHRRIGLGDLVRHYFQLGLDKRFQRHDWSSRPLEAEHLHYARSDTHFLVGLRERLWEEISRNGRTAQAREEFELVAQKRQTQKTFSPDDCLRIPGAQEHDVRRLRILRELFVMRDEIARREDLPPFRIIPNEVLHLLVRHAPSDRRAVSGIRGLHPRIARNYAVEIAQAVQRGLQSQALPPQPPPRQPRPVNAAEIDARFQRLKKWRQARAEREQLDPAVVASNAILYCVAKENPRDLEQLRAIPQVRNWQVEAFGDEWLTLLRGR